MAAKLKPQSREAELAQDLRPAVLRLARQLRRVANRVGVSALDGHLLAIIARRDGIGVSELADMEQISRPAMSAHVRRMEEAGWIARDESLADKRRSGLSLTRSGRAALMEMRRESSDWLAERLTRLSASERQAVAQALGPLSKLVDDL